MRKSSRTEEDLIKEVRLLRSRLKELKNTTPPQNPIEEERNLLHTLIDNLPVHVYVKDAESRFVIANNTVVRYMGVKTMDELLGKTDFDFLPAERAQKYYADEQAIIKSGQPMVNQEDYYVNEAGNGEWGVSTKVPLRDSSGKIVGIVGIGQIITKRKQAEETLRQERNLLRTLIDNLPCHVYIKDTQSRFTACNMEVAHAVGAKTPDEVLGKTDLDLLPIERAQKYYDEEQAIIRSGQPMVNREDSSVDEAGNREWGVTTKVPFRDGSGKIVGIVGIGQIITKRKQAEEALTQERNLLRTLIDNLPDHIYVKDVKSRFVIANEAVVRLMGLRTMDELIGKTDFDFHRREMAEQYYADEQRVIKSGRPLLNKEEQFIDRSGNKRWLSTTKVPLRDSSGGVVGLVGINRDITRQKQAQEKLLNYQEQLKSLASKLSLGEERERRRVAMQLHDQIAQSLVISKLKLEALLKSSLSADAAGILAEVCKSLDTTIQDTKSLTFDLSYPVLYELGFEMAVEGWLVENIREKHGIATEFYDDGKPKPLDDDISALLFRDVRELLINVVKHAHAQKVKVSIRRIGNRIRVTVEDDGIGFNSDEILSGPVRKQGFGLFSIRERLGQLGECFEIESRAGHGTKIAVTASLKRQSIKKEKRARK